jgi:uncharacterized protein YcfJ
MNSKIQIGFTTVVLGVLAATAQAGSGRDRYDHDHDHDRGRGYAKVLHVDPILERVRYSVPVEQCWDEHREVRRGGSEGAAIVGGVLGAVIGNNVGRGSGVATVGGAVLGAAIGNEVARDGRGNRVRHEVVRRCEVRDEERWEDRVVAYRVTYVYNGRRDVTRLAYDPGRYFEIGRARRYG